MADNAEVATRSRGRPQQLPYDGTSRADKPDGNKRLAWLLATTRLMAPSTAGVPRASFVRALRETGLTADPSRISRWESGLEPLPRPLLRGYEEVCELGPHTLDLVRRLLERAGYLDARQGRHAAPEAPDPDGLDAVVDELAEGRATGSDWLAFVDQHALYERVYLGRRMWGELTTTLVDELCRAQGLAALRRYEAAAALVTDEHARAYLSRSIGVYALGTGPRPVAPVLPLLGEVDSPEAAALVLRLLASGDPRLREGAAAAATTMVARGVLDSGAPDLERYVAHGLTGAWHPGALPSSSVIELALELDKATFGRRIQACTNPRLRKTLIQVRADRELVHRDTARTLSHQVALKVEERLGRRGQDPDPMLRTLVREALFHVSRDRRTVASSVLTVSPFGSAVAETVLEVTGDEDAHVARLAWSAVRRLAPTLEQRSLLDRVVGESRAELRHLAIRAVPAAEGELPDDVAAHLAKVAAHGRARESDAAFAALGLGGHQDRISAIAAASDNPTAAWWARSRPAVRV